jgi:hypothetical protein
VGKGSDIFYIKQIQNGIRTLAAPKINHDDHKPICPPRSFSFRSGFSYPAADPNVHNCVKIKT